MSDKKKLIQPRTLKGFRDFPPALAMPREQMIDAAKAVFRSYGFAPIDTPALEYSEILTGKGGEESDKQMYRFTDHGERDVALRFDLTVPFARFAAQHAQQLGLPFKRYQVGPVWRGENTQRGRYREFYQCDFDTIGTNSNTSDIETALIIHDILAVLRFERFKIHVNNRKILSGLLETLGLSEQATPVLRALDKLAKIGADKVAAEMASAGLSDAQAAHILQTVQTEGSNRAVLDQLSQQLSASERAMEGVADLRQLVDVFEATHISEDRLRVDVSIARGLDYYTGTVYETLLDDLPDIGSICSGGRYDNLAALYTKQHLPGVGASLGLDRLLAATEELGLIAQTSTPAQLFIVQFTPDALGSYIALSRRLRAAGFATEVSAEPKGMGKQLKYADRKGFRFALIGGPDELQRGVWQVKDLRGKGNAEVAEDDLIEQLRSMF